jgi:hypothetical protein
MGSGWLRGEGTLNISDESIVGGEKKGRKRERVAGEKGRKRERVAGEKGRKRERVGGEKKGRKRDRDGEERKGGGKFEGHGGVGRVKIRGRWMEGGIGRREGGGNEEMEGKGDRCWVIIDQSYSEGGRKRKRKRRR